MKKMINIIASSCVISNNKILMVQENKVDIQGLWDLPGGKVKIDEDIKQAVIRETLEETGYNIDLDSILLIQNYVTDNGVLLIIYFNATLHNTKQEKFRKEEISNVKWFTLEEIKNMSKKNIRGGDGFDRILYNINNKIKYSLNILDIHNYINKKIDWE